MADQVAIASTVYNLAGDEESRPDFLKSLVLGGILHHAESLGKVLTDGYRNGPAFRLRSFAKWVKDNPEFQSVVGLTKGSLQSREPINLDIVDNYLPLDAGQSLEIKSAEIGQPDINYWVLRYLAANSPEVLNLNYTYEYSWQSQAVVIHYTDNAGLSRTVVFSTADYISNTEYLYVHYTPINNERVGPSLESQVTTLATGEEFPSMDGWQQGSIYPSTASYVLETTEEVHITYSDGRLPQVYNSASQSTSTVQESRGRYYKDEYMGKDVTDPYFSFYSLRTYNDHCTTHEVVLDAVNLTQTETLPNGVVKTTNTIRGVQRLQEKKQIRIGTQKVTHKTWLPARYFIYQKNTGIPDLDVFFAPSVDSDANDFFYPPIPFRYNNEPVTSKRRIWKVRFDYDWDGPRDTAGIFFAPSLAATSKAVRAQWYDRDADDPLLYTLINFDDSNWLADALKGPAPVWQSRGWTADGTEWKSEWFPVLNTPEPVESAASISPMAIAYPICKKAFKKAMNANFDDVQNNIMTDNPNIRDIDYIYTVFGIPLNIKENTCRKYIYKFFQRLKETVPSLTPTAEAAWWTSWNEAHASHVAWNAWQNAGANPATEPTRIRYPSIPWRIFSIESVHDGVSDYRTHMQWAFMNEETGVGLLKADAKRDDLWFETLPDPVPADELFADIFALMGTVSPQFNQKIALCWQETATTWRKMTVVGFNHYNHIYKDHAGHIMAKTALADTEESGFLIPIHEGVLRSMTLVDSTQVSSACYYLVFNCYAVKKQPWYSTTWFKVVSITVLVVVAVAAAVYTGGTSLGLLGTAVEVGTALGLSGTAAIIAGATINALAALVIGFIISQGSIEIFGEKWGSLIGGILSLVISMGMNAGSLADAWKVLTSADGLLALSMAAGNGTASYLQASAKEVSESTAKLMAEWSEKAAEIQKLYDEEFNKNNKIDLNLIHKYVSDLTEKPEQFLTRTLMTGSDIVKMTTELIDNFAEHNLRLELP